MKFKTEWWGITLIAENSDDDNLLVELSNRLPQQINWDDRYENGTQELSRCEDGLLTLKFKR